jgi:DNA-binding SARP family transcriptional activator
VTGNVDRTAGPTSNTRAQAERAKRDDELPTRVRVRVLGPFEVEGVAREHLGSRKARTLLKVLALGRGDAVAVDRIVEACWGGDAPARPGDQVAVLVSRLRGVLGRERIVRSDAGYSLLADWLDLAAVDELASEAAQRLTAAGPAAARSAATAALALVRGPLLADEPDATWTELDRAALDRTVARLRHLAAEAALATGDCDEAATLAEGALDHDPYDEQALRWLMAAWARAGRPASALAAYARTRERLSTDLGVDPASETEKLHTAILRGEELPGIVPAANQEPAPEEDAETPAVLPGRSAALAALTDACGRAGAGLVAVSVEGEAGIGKSALLDAWERTAGSSGVVVLRASCDELERSLPLQVVLDALAGHLRGRDRDEIADVLGDEVSLLGPLLADPGASAGRTPYSPIEGAIGPTLLFGAMLAVLGRIAARSAVALLLDDMHLAGASTVEWLQFARRRRAECALLVVAARRPEEGPELPADETIVLGPLDLAAAELVVGPERAAELHARSGGNPLFLVELASADPDAELPSTIRESVAARCARAGDAEDTLRTAALLGAEVDLDLLATILGRPPIEVLEHLEEGARRRIVGTRGSSFVFTHDLVRGALVADATSTRAALVHREAARVLAARPDADPLEIAFHARLGGDDAIAAEAYARAAALAGERWDHEVAEGLLDRSLQFDDTIERRLDRARVRMLRGRYRDAIVDADDALARGGGATALEVAGWAAYWDRDLVSARELAEDAVVLASDPGTRAGSLLLAGRLRHVAGDLDGAERCFVEAAGLAEGSGLTVASVWLGTLRAHQSRLTEALDLLRAATRPGGPPGQIAARLHALLFTAHAAALAGQPADALRFLDDYAAEVERTQVLRFSGRAENFKAWILRSLGAAAEADELNRAAMDSTTAIPETPLAAHLDLADGFLHAGDLGAASPELDAAERLLGAHMVFGWRHQMKAELHRARLLLAAGDVDDAEGLARALADRADTLGVPRYAVPARLLVARTRARRGETVVLDSVAVDLDRLDRVDALEAWWTTADVALDLRSDSLANRARDRAGRLAGASGPRREGLLAAADRRLAPLA